jgi:hypothetical protein
MHPEVVPALVDGMVYTTMFPGGNRHTSRPIISGGVALHALGESQNKASPPLEDTQAGGEKSLEPFAVPAGLVLRKFTAPLSAASSSRLSDDTKPKTVLADDVFDVLYSLIAKNSPNQREDTTDAPETSPAEEEPPQEAPDNKKKDAKEDNEAEEPGKKDGEAKEEKTVSDPPEPLEEPEPTESAELAEEKGGEAPRRKPFPKISIKVPTKRTRGASNRKTRRKARGGQAPGKPT